MSTANSLQIMENCIRRRGGSAGLFLSQFWEYSAPDPEADGHGDQRSNTMPTDGRIGKRRSTVIYANLFRES